MCLVITFLSCSVSYQGMGIKISMIVDWSVSPFSSVSFLFMYFWAILLGAYSCSIIVFLWLLLSIKCSFLICGNTVLCCV